MKIFGLILVIAGPTFLGFKEAETVNDTLLYTEGFLKLIRHIKYEISTFLTKQKDIFSSFNDVALEKCGFLNVLKNTEVTGEESILYKVIAEYKDNLNLSPKTEKLLIEFSKTLGYTSMEEQIKSCDFYYIKLEEEYKELEVQVKKKVKLYRTLGFVFGLAVAIVIV